MARSHPCTTQQLDILVPLRTGSCQAAAESTTCRAMGQETGANNTDPVGNPTWHLHPEQQLIHFACAIEQIQPGGVWTNSFSSTPLKSCAILPFGLERQTALSRAALGAPAASLDFRQRSLGVISRD
ncbi:hypothetical protein MHYP_G00222120 [Metynnis hypsauchen]